MILNDTYSIEEDSGGFALIEKKEGRVKVDGEFVEGRTKTVEIKYFYGCIYQALIGFLNKVPSGRDIDDLKTKVEEIINIIREAETEIKKTFRIEISVAGRKIEEDSDETDLNIDLT